MAFILIFSAIIHFDKTPVPPDPIPMKLRSVHYIIGGLWLATMLFAFALGHTANPTAAKISADALETDTSPKAPAMEKRVIRRSDPVTVSEGGGGTMEGYVFRAPVPADEEVESDLNGAEKARSALGQVDPLLRMQSFSRLLSDLDAADVAEIAGDFQNVPFQRRLEFNLLLYRWAQLDGEAAVSYVQTMEGGDRGRGWNMGSVMSGWASQDPDAAIAWASANSEGSDNRYMTGIIYGVAQTDLDRATELALEMPFGRNRGRAVDALLDASLQGGTDHAVAWVQDLPDGDLKYGIMGRLADRVEDIEFQDFAKELMALPEAELATAADPFLRQWARDDPASAAGWAVLLPTVEMQTKAMAGVVRRWARSDSAAAGEWLALFQPSLDMDKVILSYIDRIDRRDPSSAARWATTLTDPDLRNTTMAKFHNR